ADPGPDLARQLRNGLPAADRHPDRAESVAAYATRLFSELPARSAPRRRAGRRDRHRFHLELYRLGHIAARTIYQLVGRRDPYPAVRAQSAPLGRLEPDQQARQYRLARDLVLARLY